MFKIRRNVFETNSSSTHTITLCSHADWDKFVKGELNYSHSENKLISSDDSDDGYVISYKDFISDDNNSVAYAEDVIDGVHVHAIASYGFDY